MSTKRIEVDVQALMPLIAAGRRKIINTKLVWKLKMAEVSIIIFCLICILVWMHEVYRSPVWKQIQEIEVFNDKPLFGKAGDYVGDTWWTEQTVSKVIAAETKFARCDVHTVRREDGSYISDWLFLEERNTVNVIVVNMAGQFVMFRQRKYGIEGETLSPVGGFIEGDETPIQAAKREAFEELGVGSPATLEHDTTENDHTTENDPDWIFLGKYRTAVNRGAGFSNFFLLKNAVPLVLDGGSHLYKGNTGDIESQTILLMNKDEIFDAISKAQFQEVKWTAALALSLLHLQEIVPLTS